MKKKLPIPILLVLFCFLTMPFKSCVDSDDYDFDKLSDKIDWQPNFVAPVGYGEYSLWYLLNQHEVVLDDQTIVLGDDGLIHIKYTEANIFEYTVDEVLNFPAQDAGSVQFDMTGYPTVAVPFPADVDLAAIDETFDIKAGDTGIKLKELKLDTKVTFTVSNPVDKAITLNVALKEETDDVIFISQDFTVQPNAVSQKIEWDLTDLIFTFSNPSIDNTIGLKFGVKILKGGDATIVSNGNDLDITYQFGGLDFKLATGDFGNQTIDIGSGDIDMGVDFWDDIDGSFTFADPRINVKFNNTVGLPFKVLANMTASNSDGDVLNLDPDAQLPDYPRTEAEVLAGIEALILYNKDNSQIVPFMALPPSGNITYSGSVKINENLDGTRYDPLAVGNNINIISGNSSIAADLEMDIPMDFKADNLSISDTIDGIDISDADKMMKAAIIITSENGLPLDVKIENIFFTDAAYTVLSTISNESIINAAGVTATGEVDASTITKEVNRIELTEAQIESLNDTENIIIKAVVSTYDEGKQSVKLQGTDKLKFSISVSAQLDLSK